MASSRTNYVETEVLNGVKCVWQSKNCISFLTFSYEKVVRTWISNKHIFFGCVFVTRERFIFDMICSIGRLSNCIYRWNVRNRESNNIHCYWKSRITQVSSYLRLHLTVVIIGILWTHNSSVTFRYKWILLKHAGQITPTLKLNKAFYSWYKINKNRSSEHIEN